MIEVIPLRGRVKGGAAIEFLSVEVPFESDRYIPFALVRYAVDGQSQSPDGLRLDLDKGTFTDHFPYGEQREQLLRQAGPQIAEIVAERLKKLTYERLKRELG
jgi:hypothetical protein